MYFIGIGGIGMSAIARYFHAHGKNVSGYDKTPTPLTDELINEGIGVHFEDDVQLVRSSNYNCNDCLVVLTPAVPKEHEELNYFLQEGFTVLKRSQVLGLITQNHFTIAVAGTHGKTTTSSMIAHMLQSSGCQLHRFSRGHLQKLRFKFIAAL